MQTFRNIQFIIELGIWKQFAAKEGLNPAYLENIIGSVQKAIKEFLNLRKIPDDFKLQ
jgi:hypothetical protein